MLLKGEVSKISRSGLFLLMQTMAVVGSPGKLRVIFPEAAFRADIIVRSAKLNQGIGLESLALGLLDQKALGSYYSCLRRTSVRATHIG